MESTGGILEAKRFAINPDSLEMFKKARSVYTEFSHEYPFLAGIGIYGSRTRGTERPDSDLDLKIFYDINKVNIESDYIGKLEEVRERIANSVGVKLDDHVFLKNISIEKTDIDIYNYFKFARTLNKAEPDQAVVAIANMQEAENLFARFLLGVGNGLYANRKYVLDEFSGYADGDKYFDLLMKALGTFERDRRGRRPDIPKFQGYPSTIEEARAYFLTEPRIG